MALLWTILRESGALLSRNFILIYPMLIFTLVASFMVPQGAGLPALEARWILWGAVILMFYAAFTAGTYQMIQGVVQASSQLSEAPNASGRPGLWGAFFEGVGAFFLPVLLGKLMELAVIAGLGYWAASSVPDALWNRLQTLQDPAAAEAFLTHLPPTQIALLSRLMLLVTGGVVLFFLLTMLWPAFLVVGRRNLLQAYGASVRQFFTTPLPLLAMGFGYLFTNMALLLLSSAENPLLAALLQFISMAFNLYFLFVLFLYVIRVTGIAPVPQQQGEALDSENASQNPLS